MFVNQRKYTMDILHDTGIMQAKLSSVPFPEGTKLTDEGSKFLDKPYQYRRLVGKLLYLSMTRPDITYVAQQLSQYMQQPRTYHWHAALYVLRYLKGYLEKGLFFPTKSDVQLKALWDADWAACTISRKSISRFCVS